MHAPTGCAFRSWASWRFICELCRASFAAKKEFVALWSNQPEAQTWELTKLCRQWAHPRNRQAAPIWSWGFSASPTPTQSRRCVTNSVPCPVRCVSQCCMMIGRRVRPQLFQRPSKAVRSCSLCLRFCQSRTSPLGGGPDREIGRTRRPESVERSCGGPAASPIAEAFTERPVQPCCWRKK
jgi:hypothetical protein